VGKSIPTGTVGEKFLEALRITPVS